MGSEETQNPYESPSLQGIRGRGTSANQVEFEFTQQDRIWFSMFENRSYQISAVRRARIVFIGAAILLALLAFQLFTLTWILALPLAIGALYFVVRTLAVSQKVENRFRKVMTEFMERRPSDGIYGTRTVSLDSTGMQTHFPGGHASWQWWAVPEIVIEEGYLLIYVSSAEANMVPARAFANDQHFHEFAANARRLWERHKHERPQ